MTAFIEGEVRTVINEAVHGWLLKSYRGSSKAELAGRMAEWYGNLTGRYDAELQHVGENISRRFAVSLRCSCPPASSRRRAFAVSCSRTAQ